MVHLVDGLVQRTIVQGTVEPVMPGILHDEEDGNLPRQGSQSRERRTVVNTKVGGDGVEEPDLGQLGGEVADEDDGGAIPLLLEGRDLLRLQLVLVEVRDLVDYHVRNAAAEVDEFVHDEAQDSGREGVVLHP